jgi:hypothetical protein
MFLTPIAILSHRPSLASQLTVRDRRSVPTPVSVARGSLGCHLRGARTLHSLWHKRQESSGIIYGDEFQRLVGDARAAQLWDENRQRITQG